MPVYSIPPDTRAVGTADPPGDMNNVSDMLGLISALFGQLAGAGTNADPAGNATNVAAANSMRNAASLAPGAAGTYLRSAGTNVNPVFHTINAADLPAATTGAQGAVQFDGTAADIVAAGTQSAGAVGKVADSGHIHPQVNGTWLPSSGSTGWLGWNTDVCTVGAANNTTAGGVYLQRLNFYAPTTITNLIYVMTVLGSGTSTGTFVGLYSSAGTRLTTSSDLATSFNASGTVGAVTCPVTTPQSFTAGQFCWAAIVTNLSVTQPTLARQVNVATEANAGLTAANFRWCVNGSGQTSLPTSITPSSNSTASPFNANTFFVAWS